MEGKRLRKVVLGALAALLTLSLAGGVALAAGQEQQGDAPGSVGVVPPEQGRPRALGKVTAVHGKKLEVETRRGTFEVLTDEETAFRVPGVGEPTIKDIEVGDLVAGKVFKQEDGSLLAVAIAVIPPPGPNERRGIGKVTAVHGKTLEVKTRRNGTVEILTDDETVFRVPGVEEPTIKDIEVGDLVAGKVAKQEDGTLLAVAIAVIPLPRPNERRGIGRVTAIYGKTLEVETWWCTAEIQTDEETTFRVPGVEEPTIEDIKVGDLIAGAVIKQQDGTLLATAIGVLPPRVERLRPSTEAAP